MNDKIISIWGLLIISVKNVHKSNFQNMYVYRILRKINFYYIVLISVYK